MLVGEPIARLVIASPKVGGQNKPVRNGNGVFHAWEDLPQVPEIIHEFRTLGAESLDLGGIGPFKSGNQTIIWHGFPPCDRIEAKPRSQPSSMLLSQAEECGRA